MEDNNESFFSVDRKNLVNEASMRPVSDIDTQVLSKTRPFLEISSCDAAGQPFFINNTQDLAADKLDSGSYGGSINIETSLGWNLQYWPGGSSWASLCSASPGSQLYYGSQPIFGEADYLVGTTMSQAVEVALFVVYLAKQQNWPGVKINNAEDNMRWAAWLAADYYSLPLFGFEISKQAIARKERALPVLKELLNANIQYDIKEK
jgi:hypothetical protein